MKSSASLFAPIVLQNNGSIVLQQYSIVLPHCSHCPHCSICPHCPHCSIVLRTVTWQVSSCQCDNMSMCQHVNMSSCQCVNMSTCHHVNVSSCQCVNMSSCQCVIMSMCQYVNVSTCQCVNMSSFQFVNMSTARNLLHSLRPLNVLLFLLNLLFAEPVYTTTQIAFLLRRLPLKILIIFFLTPTRVLRRLPLKILIIFFLTPTCGKFNESWKL